MNGYVLSADANLDLDDIWEYIADDSIAQADRWIAKLFDAFEILEATLALDTGARPNSISGSILACRIIPCHLPIITRADGNCGGNPRFTRHSGIFACEIPAAKLREFPH